jgi:hypothetical protein
MPIRRIICGKSKLSANYPEESFSMPWKVKILLFKGLSLLLQIVLDKKSTMGDHTNLDWEEKSKKNMV